MPILTLQFNLKHVEAMNGRMQVPYETSWYVQSRSNHPSQGPHEENTACVQPDLILPAHGALSRKLFYKTYLLCFSDSNQVTEQQ